MTDQQSWNFSTKELFIFVVLYSLFYGIFNFAFLFFKDVLYVQLINLVQISSQNIKKLVKRTL
ncbi:hypothetical protein [Siminovitchia fordii]|uniref:ATP synthase F0 subunit 8 n=1 Tax=Siminovitchia fordii TaxID=254759 RepID=A0ABQ4KAF8_9BACI|nr:hypothetical protein [Siminovitchia fordii]GIN22707.1 hypothetical protein J1TS3_38410 [Siminovitchia fordii]